MRYLVKLKTHNVKKLKVNDAEIQPLETIAHWFVERLRESGSRTAIHFPETEGDGFHSLTWEELAAAVFMRCMELQELGVGVGDHVAHLSENRMDWIVSDLAIQFAGAVHIPFHALSTPQQVNELIKHCEPKLIIVSNQQQIEKLADVMAGDLSQLKIASYDSISVDKSIGSPTRFQSMVPANSSMAAESSRAVERLSGLLLENRLSADDLISILYTSGTTGEPKGVMLSQRNVTSNVVSKLRVLPLSETDIRICVLPLTHIFARVCDVYTWIASGSQLVISRGPKHVFDEFAIHRLTYLNGVPYIYEKAWRTLRDLGRLDEPHALSHLFGGCLRIANCGGAAIADHVFDYYWDHGVALVTGYGLTETSPVLSSSSPDSIRRGAVGKAVEHVCLKISDDGEVCAKGPNVMLGYYKNRDATDKVFRNGWFLTGDIGAIDEDGFLFLKGRKKELIVTNGGKNISPVQIETLLNEDPLIEQSMVIGDGQDFLTTLIVLAPPCLARELPRADVESEIANVLRTRLNELPKYDQIAGFHIVEQPFSIENGQLTAKSTLRRDAITMCYQTEIAAMYTKLRDV